MPTTPVEPRKSSALPGARLLGLVLLVLLLWELREVVLLCFGAIIVCAALRALSEPLASKTGLAPRAALAVVALGVALLIGATMWLVGDMMATQLQELRTALPRAWAAAREWLQGSGLGRRLLEMLNDSQQDVAMPWSRLALAATAVTSAIAHAVLVLLLGIYLALDPRLYRDGFLRLVPIRHRSRIGGALDASGHGLKRWLLGQGVAMLAVGVTVGVGLALMGMPLAPALGLIAGLLEFVPYFGPIASALLAVLVAFSLGPMQALYVAIFFVVVQQLEGHILIPIVQRWSVHLPPVLSLLAIVIFGSLFGIAGVLVGAPLMVVVVTLVDRLYVRSLTEPAD